MNTISNFIVKYRFILMPLFAVLICVSAYMYTFVDVNYNIIDYLSQESDSIVSLDKMTEEFGSNGSAQIMAIDITKDDAVTIYKQIKALDGVNSVIFDESSEQNYKDNKALYTIYLDTSDYDSVSYDIIDDIEAIFSDYTIAVSGSSVRTEFLRLSVTEDMPTILLVACIIVFAILLLSSSSWIEPLIFLFIIFGSIIINLGTNLLLGSISYITNSICAILQLALAMDYSIVLLHSYRKQLTVDSDNKVAMKNAISNAFKPISSSGLTTIAGLLALLFMSFSIGFDIGITLSKGIFISLACVILFMPGFLLLFDKAMKKTAHRNIFDILFFERKRVKNGSETSKSAKYMREMSVFETPCTNEESITTDFDTNKKPINNQITLQKNDFSKYGNFIYKTRFIFPIILIVLIACGAILNSNLTYNYALETSNDPSATINVDDNLIVETFGEQNVYVFIVPNDDYGKEIELINSLYNYQDANGDKVVSSVSSMTATGLYDYYDSALLSSSFGISESLFEPLFDEMGCQSAMLIDILNYIEETNYLAETFSLISTQLQSSYNSLLSMLFSVKSSTMASNLAINQTVVDMIYELMGGASSYSAKNFVTYIYNNDVINTIYNDFQADIDSLLESYSFDNDDTILSMEQACSQFYYIPTDYITQIFGENSQLSLYQILTQLSQNQTAISAGAELQTYCNTLAYYFIDITKDELSAIIPLPETIIEQMLGNNTTMSTYNALSYLYKNDIVDNLSATYTAMLNDLIEDATLATSLFVSQNYCRILVSLSYSMDSPDNYTAVEDFRVLASEIYDEYYLCGTVVTYSDISYSFSKEIIVINLISFFAIFLIIALTFKSLLVPLLLSGLIEGAIWVTMSLTVIAGSGIYFICYIICLCIQTGATIDYAILLTNKYLNARKSLQSQSAISLAMKESLPTIFTSGTILVLATLIIGLICNVALISEIGLLLFSGSLISLSFITIFLPQLLVLFDKYIAPKSRHEDGENVTVTASVKTRHGDGTASVKTRHEDEENVAVK